MWVWGTAAEGGGSSSQQIPGLSGVIRGYPGLSGVIQGYPGLSRSRMDTLEAYTMAYPPNPSPNPNPNHTAVISCQACMGGPEAC